MVRGGWEASDNPHLNSKQKGERERMLMGLTDCSIDCINIQEDIHVGFCKFGHYINLSLDEKNLL